jgi:hypothetical protein
MEGATGMGMTASTLRAGSFFIISNCRASFEFQYIPVRLFDK